MAPSMPTGAAASFLRPSCSTSTMAARLMSMTTTRSVSALARPTRRASPLAKPSQPRSQPTQYRCYQNGQIPPQFQQFQQPQFQQFASPPPPPPPPRWRFRIFTPNRCLFLFATTVSYLGADLYLNRIVFTELNGSRPVTPDEIRHAAHVQEESIAFTDRFDIVKKMKSDADWEEWQMDTSGGPAADSADATGRVRLTTGPLGGVDGMGCGHRVFRNSATGIVVSIIYIGQSLSGWPMVVHGGALATILDEALGRCAIQLVEAGTAVTARLQLTYKKPSIAGNYFVLTCHPELEPDAVLNGGKLAQRKVWCNATLAQISKDGKAGRPNVEARALFVVPRGYSLPKVEQRF